MKVEPGHSKESEARPPGDWLNVGAKGAGRIQNIFSTCFWLPSPKWRCEQWAIDTATEQRRKEPANPGIWQSSMMQWGCAIMKDIHTQVHVFPPAATTKNQAAILQKFKLFCKRVSLLSKSVENHLFKNQGVSAEGFSPKLNGLEHVPSTL